jgi:hypothetical protein
MVYSTPAGLMILIFSNCYSLQSIPSPNTLWSFLCKEKALSDSRKVTLYDMYNTQRHGIRKNGKITATTFVAIYNRQCPCSKTGRLETTFLSVLRIRIRLEFSCWIRIRIENKDLDPYPTTGITLRF